MSKVKKKVRYAKDTFNEISDDCMLRRRVQISDSSDKSDSEWENFEKENSVAEGNNDGIIVAYFVIVVYEKRYYPGVVLKTSFSECE